MDTTFYLNAIIDTAIGVAGFAGIVAAVRQRRLDHWPIEQLLLLQILFTASAAAIVSGILPSLLSELGLNENAVWKVSSSALICWIVGAIAYRVHQSTKYAVPMPVPVHIRFWGLLTIGLQSYNVASSGQSWPYLVGILTMLMNAFSVFLILVLRPIDTENPPNKSLESDA